MKPTHLTLIGPKQKFGIGVFKEVWQYRELLLAFVVRDIKVRYKQTIIGGMWAIIQPFATMVIFSFFFGTIIKISSEGMPYPIFSYSGLVLWVYFTNAITAASNSLVANSSLITKIYFPRIIIPIASTITGLLDYLIALILVFLMMAYYQITPSINIFWLPIVVIMTTMLSVGIGFWLSAINVKYRDVQYAIPFFIQLLLFITPVIYPISIAPRFRFFLSLNPMSGLLEAHRNILINQGHADLYLLSISFIITLTIFLTGAYYFKSNEKHFADII
jgi:lipopolysaccharide transport system permease protein